jgi:hypothetical protein
LAQLDLWELSPAFKRAGLKTIGTEEFIVVCWFAEEVLLIDFKKRKSIFSGGRSPLDDPRLAPPLFSL